MRMSKRAVDFNKEILFAEIGALLGAPLFGILGSLIHSTPNFISSATVFGSIIGCSSIWLVVKVHDEKKYGNKTAKGIIKKISLITPIAILISILIGYPLIFLVTHALSSRDHVTFFSSFMGEMTGFLVFLGMINSYRYVLIKKFDKEV